MKRAWLRVRCRALRVVVTDVDGVLTDAGVYYGEAGDELKKFSIRDGAGVALLKSAGLTVGAITGESHALVARRMKKIGADFLLSGVRDKLEALERHAARDGFKLSEMGYIGDEINDVCLLGKVGVFFAPADAAPEIRSGADVVLETHGGDGALREAAQIVLAYQGKLEDAIDEYVRGCRGQNANARTHRLTRVAPRTRKR